MPGVEVVGQLLGVEQLTGEQALDEGRPAPLSGLGPDVPLAPILLGDGGDQVLEGGGLYSMQPLQIGCNDVVGLRLIDDEIAEQGVAGGVATQHSLEADAAASGEAGLDEK